MPSPPPTRAPRPRRPEIVSHRGGAFLWPENSLTAFRESLALPLEQVECDVHAAADGEPMVIHDASLARTTEGRGAVAAQPAAVLAATRLRGAGGACIPRLADLAALIRGSAMQLQVELKTDAEDRIDPDLLPAVLAVLDAAGIRHRCRIISFEADVVAAAQQAGGLAGVIWLFEPSLLTRIGATGVLGVARAHGFPMVETHIRALDASLVARLREAGLGLGVWGANHAPEIRRALELGVDCLATDDPVLALRLRDEQMPE